MVFKMVNMANELMMMAGLCVLDPAPMQGNACFQWVAFYILHDSLPFHYVILVER